MNILSVLTGRRTFSTYYPYRVRPLSAIMAGIASALVFVALYYATLGLMPANFAYPHTLFPFAAWAHRFDLAQFFGALLLPPYPTPLSWIIGCGVLFGTLVAFAVVYAIVLAWALIPATPRNGVVFGSMLFLGLAAVISVASGVHPATMRNAIPDVGLLLLGWSPWATLQLLVLCVLFGGSVGTLYRRLG